MTEPDFLRIEAELSITLPPSFREAMGPAADRLADMEWFGEDSCLYLEPEHFISANLQERPRDSGTSETFPNWSETFFMIGTNGGGDFYCLRLDGTPGVWSIGSDHADTPSLIAETFQKYIHDSVAEYEAWQAEIAAKEKRRLPYQAEVAAHRDAIMKANGSDRAKEWLECDSSPTVFSMLEQLWRMPSPRKMRLFGIACCEQIPGLRDDPEFQPALKLAFQMTSGTAALSEVDAMRQHYRVQLANWEKVYGSISPDDYRRRSWTLKAVYNLFGDDTAYIKNKSYQPGEAHLQSVYGNMCEALCDDSYGGGIELDLLREVLGNPFHPVPFSQDWRTPQTVELAQRIFDNEEFERMPELGQLLKLAGCTDARVLAHCERQCGHIRGCWVLDEILQLEPEVSDEFTWDCVWRHSTISPQKLNEQMQKLGVSETSQGDPLDEATALQFADWLEHHGDPAWAFLIRLRCKMEGAAPGIDYPDQMEDWFEVTALMRRQMIEMDGFSCLIRYHATADWWDAYHDSTLRGLPAIVGAVPTSQGARPLKLVEMQWAAMVSRTPVRGLDIDRHYADEIHEFLNSPSATSLQWFAFSNGCNDDTGPVIAALANSPVPKTLKRLDITGIFQDADVMALADIPFERLRHLSLSDNRVNQGSAFRKLTNSSWFKQLEQLRIDLSETGEASMVSDLKKMRRLHSLAILAPTDDQILALDQTCSFPDLRRLLIERANLSGPQMQAFCEIDAPQLIDLTLHACQSGSKDLAKLFESPICKNLRMLTLHRPRPHAEDLEALANSPMSANLRCLRLRCENGDLMGTLRSLANTPFTRSGAFPQLTTLEIAHPYAEDAEPDTAEFLATLALPRLRHLELDDCRFDDECAEVLVGSPAFSCLTKLSLHHRYRTPGGMTSLGARALFRSQNLPVLLELNLKYFTITDAISELLDKSLLPYLWGGSLWDTGASSELIKAVRESRPNLHIG